MKGWAVIVGIIILGLIISSGCTQPASSPSTSTTTPIQQTPLVTEQTSYSTLQPTVEITKLVETPLPLTETYSDHTNRFSFKYPSEFGIYTCNPNSTSFKNLVFVKKDFAESFVPKEIVWGLNLDVDGPPRNRTVLDWDPLFKQSVLRVYVYDVADENAWRWISTPLKEDPKGNTRLRTYDSAISEDVKYNDVRWVKITEKNSHKYYISSLNWDKIYKDPNMRMEYFSNIDEKGLAEMMPYLDIDIVSDETIHYILRYRTPVGAFVWFEYKTNATWNGEPQPYNGLNKATFEEIVKSFTIVER